MLRIGDIQNAMRYLVGWEMPFDPKYALRQPFLKSESGLKYQQAHPLMTIENIVSTMPDNWYYQYQEYDAAKTYPCGAIVRYSYTENGVIHEGLYKSMIANNVGNTPNASDFNDDFDETDFGGAWFPYSIYEDYLMRMYETGCANMVQSFLASKQVRHETKSLLQSKVFFDGAAPLGAYIPNAGNVVGYEIVPVRGMGVTVKIERVGLQFYGNTGIIKLYIFHSSSSAPMYCYNLFYHKTNGTFQWFNLDNCWLPYVSDRNNAGGAWYMVYSQNELPNDMRALKVSKDWSKEPCSGCNIGSVQDWREMTKYMQISPFRTSAQGFNGKLWDIRNNLYTSCCNYGLNVQYSVECDLTDTIIRNKYLFANVLQKQVAYECLRTMALNPSVRINRNQTNIGRNEILYELDGNPSGNIRSGLGHELRKAYMALNLDMKGIDRICLPCHTGGVNYGAVR